MRKVIFNPALLVGICLLVYSGYLAFGQSSDRVQMTVDKPGFVPVGGMIAVMKSIPNAWQPGATGVIKDDFQLADGAAFAAGCTLTGNTPSMTGRYLKGHASSSGSTSSATTQNANTLSTVKHYHTFEAGNTLSATASTSSRHAHTIATGEAASTWYEARGLFNSGATGTYGGLIDSATPDSTVAVWAVGNLNGKDSAHSHVMSGNIGEPSSSGGVDGNVNQALASGTIGGFEPDNITTVWVIRCR